MILTIEKNTVKIGLVSLAMLLTLVCAPVNAGSYAVIVNASNNYAGDKTTVINVVKRLYLKQQSSWPSGGKAKVLARKDGTPIQKAFIKSVLGMSDAELASHWISLKQKTGETPSRSVRSGKIVIKLVEKNANAMAFVEKGDLSKMTGKAKVLFEF